MADFNLQGDNAFVTGASSGLGRQFALTLARAGARVAIAARRTDRLEELKRAIESIGGRALPLKLDVTDPNSVARCIESAETELGALTILVNNAGVARPKWIGDTTLDDYNYVMDTNVRGAWLVARAVGMSMIKHGHGGRIVNIASMAAFKVLPQLAVYAMAKAAVVQMTRAMALEWTRYAIRVNAIAPGYIVTEMNSDYFNSEAGRAAIGRMPRRRIGQPSDLDGTLLLLASKASDLITGTVIMVDDGQTLQ